MHAEVATDAGDRVEEVVLLDPDGRPVGTAPKAGVHHAATPYHLAFSAHVVDRRGRVLLTRRAPGKPTWPGVWTNACCGHPAPGETLREAVTRRLAHELGLTPVRMGVALPDFSYRATMADGTAEHELCPVVVAEVDGRPAPNPDEVAGTRRLRWPAFLARARRRPHSLRTGADGSRHPGRRGLCFPLVLLRRGPLEPRLRLSAQPLSPWAVAQAAVLARVVADPLAWLDAHAVPPPDPDARRATSTTGIGLDVAVTVPDPPDPADPLTPVRAPVERVLREALAAGEAELLALDPELAPVTGEVRGLVAAGGKRLRPAFVYWGHRATGADHDDAVLTVAAAVELLHTFALLHDDVMDRSPTRRGRRTAYRTLADHHAAAGLRGDATRFGVSAAVLAGDLAFVWADDLLDRAALAPAARARARQAFTTLRVEVMAGQYLDLRLAEDPDAGEAAAERVALLKSGRYTVTRPLQLGAALAPPDPDPDARAALDATLRRYGDAVGVAFQLRDDILGLVGDPAETGKGRLDDLRAGKRTLLVLRALRLAPAADRTVLAGALGDPDLDEADGARCRAIVAGCGALASVEADLDAHHARALAAAAGLTPPARGALERLAGLALRRRA
ncbi:MAG TPA: isopentenyl-diphosphate Delta-isomerase [Acidimicrobiales bacterium]|nr:isopentenyl-diphosphate Delta-isomerase [Acidimicrobiales bacterium]